MSEMTMIKSLVTQYIENQLSVARVDGSFKIVASEKKEDNFTKKPYNHAYQCSNRTYYL